MNTHIITAWLPGENLVKHYCIHRTLLILLSAALLFSLFALNSWFPNRPLTAQAASPDGFQESAAGQSLPVTGSLIGAGSRLAWQSTSWLRATLQQVATDKGPLKISSRLIWSGSRLVWSGSQILDPGNIPPQVNSKFIWSGDTVIDSVALQAKSSLEVRSHTFLPTISASRNAQPPVTRSIDQ